MDGLHVVVCIKAVPKPEEVGMNPETRTLDRAKARNELNPADLHALEMGLSLRDRFGGRVSLLSMGPPFFVPFLQVGLGMGADAAYLLSDRAFGGADTLATSYTLAQGVRRIAAEAGGYDLVLCGEESSDGATAQVPPGMAEWLGVAQATYVAEAAFEMAAQVLDGDVVDVPAMRVKREIKGGHEVLRVRLPAVCSVVAGCNAPRFFDPARRQAGQVTVWDAAAIDADPQLIGASGSATQVAGVEQAGHIERRRQIVEGTPEEEARQLVAVIRSALAE